MTQILQNSDISSKVQALTPFLDSLQGSAVSDNTIRAYAADVERFCEFLAHRGKTELAAVDAGELDNFFRQLAFEDASSATVRRMRVSLRRFFRFLFEQGTIATNPFAGLSFETAFQDQLTLTSILGIVTYCRRHAEGENGIRYMRDEVILLLMIIYGVRQCQVAGLRLSGLRREGDHMLLRVTGEFSLKIEGVILHRLLAYLKQRNSKADQIFVEKGGKPLSSRSLHTLMVELTYAVRVHVHPLSLHHTFLHLQRHPDDASQLLRELTELEKEGSD